MAHESNDIACNLVFVEVVERSRYSGNVGGRILEKGNAQFQDYPGKIIVIEVTVCIVGEVLDVVDHAGVLFARDYLEGLDYDFAVLDTLACECGKPERRSVIVADFGAVSGVLAGSCTVDADSGGVGEENIVGGECRLVSFDGGVERIESLLPGRSECHEQNDLVVLLLALDHLVDSILIL